MHTWNTNMKISTRGRYSLRLMLDLALHYEEDFVSLKDISIRQNISKKYLEQIVPFLSRGNLLVANRGHMGGYRLSKPVDKITVGEILKCAEGNMYPVSCMENSPNVCPYNSECMTLPIWEGLYKVVNDYLDSITLKDVLEKNTTNVFSYEI